jgi:polyisoprenoid-binding protein YceI
MKNILLPGLLSLGLAGVLTAAPMTFDFKDPKGVNSATFKLDALLEPIAGSANGVSGKVSFDPAAPEATTGKIAIAAETLTTPNKKMTEHLLGPDWLSIEDNPEITFEVTKLSNVKTTPVPNGTATTADATGKFFLNGASKEITVPVTLTHLPDSLGKRINKPEVKGDLLVIRANFVITRTDFKIQPGKHEDKVANEIAISLAIAGSAPKS